MNGLSLVAQSIKTYFQLAKRKGIKFEQKNLSLRLKHSLKLLSGLLNTSSPIFGIIAITSRCPLSCWHCSLERRNKGEPSLEQLKSIIHQLAEIGTLGYVITGGEPFLRDDLAEIVKTIPRLSPVFIYSSGVGLKEKVAQQLAKFSNLVVVLSVDHLDPKIHNQRRGSERAWDWVFQAKEILERYQVPVHITTVITRDRIWSGEFEEFCITVKEKWKVDFMQVFTPRPVGRLKSIPEEVLSSKDLEQFKQLVLKILPSKHTPFLACFPIIESEEAMGCCGGFVRLYISPSGDFYPCDFNPLCFGNVFEEPIKNLWQKMHSYFYYPAEKCFIEKNWKKLEKYLKDGIVHFEQILSEPELKSPNSAFIYKHFGTITYRITISYLSLANVVWMTLKQSKII